jgi:hypothetical protein
MSDMSSLRLPASELAKLRPRHPQGPTAPPDGVAPAPSASHAVPAAATRRRRPVHHLSGFARA